MKAAGKKRGREGENERGGCHPWLPLITHSLMTLFFPPFSRFFSMGEGEVSVAPRPIKRGHPEFTTSRWDGPLLWKCLWMCVWYELRDESAAERTLVQYGFLLFFITGSIFVGIKRSLLACHLIRIHYNHIPHSCPHVLTDTTQPGIWG